MQGALCLNPPLSAGTHVRRCLMLMLLHGRRESGLYIWIRGGGQHRLRNGCTVLLLHVPGHGGSAEPCAAAHTLYPGDHLLCNHACGCKFGHGHVRSTLQHVGCLASMVQHSSCQVSCTAGLPPQAALAGHVPYSTCTGTAPQHPVDADVVHRLEQSWARVVVRSPSSGPRQAASYEWRPSRGQLLKASACTALHQGPLGIRAGREWR